MGQPVPENDLPGSQVPEEDLPAQQTQLEPQKEGPIVPDETAAIGAVAPAVTGAAYATETGLPQLVKNVGQAVGPIAGNAIKGYMSNPMNALADIALTHTGLGPLVGVNKAYETYKNAKQVVNNLNDMVSRYAPGTVEQATKWVNALTPEDSAKFLETANKEGLDKTLKNFKAPSYLGEEATAALNATKNAIPSTLSKFGAVASPFLRGAGRVLGPAGMAMNVYDAGQMARETGLGGRLAGGEAQRAPQAFTGMLNRNVSGYTPNAQEARNILSSGDERTINMYGGRLKLQGLASPGPNAFNSGFAQQLNRLG